MKKQFAILLTVILGILLINSEVDAAGLVPKINSISPNPVYDGDYITILGENFEDCYPSAYSDNAAAIFLDGVEITSYGTFSWDKNKWTNGQIVLKIYATEGGKLKIRNCDNLVSNEVDLVVTKRNPVLISLEPNEVYETFGYSTGPWQYITVHGTDFGNTLVDDAEYEIEVLDAVKVTDFTSESTEVTS